MDSYIKFKRTEYEEPYHTQLEVSASNGDFSGSLLFYNNISSLEDLGGCLIDFPNNTSDCYRYEIGSKNQSKSAYYFLMNFSVLDSLGHCLINFIISNHEKIPDDGAASFSIKADPSEINKLGRLFLQLHSFEIRDFTWESK